ncbi:hypothetical protein CFN58_06595 [Pseudomonas avellanae]|uniref:Uncharacterized protein n=2 Tax=Pseudomonas syringae group TaxID=136849 RepID=A0A261WMB3_9PSED|nr:hypothetical protein [Pseudomonas syringae]NAT15162.1 hypothetical protein [Pseudomonas syringae pv. actinidifoliorum]OZI87043.1 hypothetical protein CFN58_06595 [Pseudomonas avellanae]ATV19994.1 hypothetical protein CT122_26780 [Pseudomonas syringae pv. actinidiae]MBL3831629.1 hypothetical protein [Pseudomonas syringae pv. theae]MBL3834599.1 hypothetical protein [Pseudomonas syringae pv. theae]
MTHANNQHRESLKDASYRYEVASLASKAERQLALRDPKAWGEQALVIVVAGLKCLSLTYGLDIVLRQSVQGFESLPPGVLAPILATLVLLLAGFNPWKTFWHSVFSKRASAAYWKALADLDGYSI